MANSQEPTNLSKLSRVTIPLPMCRQTPRRGAARAITPYTKLNTNLLSTLLKSMAICGRHARQFLICEVSLSSNSRSYRPRCLLSSTRGRATSTDASIIMDITKAIVKSWRKQDRPLSILDTRYSGTNIIAPQEVTQVGLPKLDPLDRLIMDANGGISKASDKTRICRPVFVGS